MARYQARRTGRGRAGVVAIAALALAACDVDVINPGPAQDDFLDDPGAFDAVVEGAVATAGFALNWVAYTGAYISMETVPSGNVGNLFGAPTAVRERGVLEEDDNNTHWNNAHQARWVAEDGIRRFERAMEPDEFASSARVAKLQLRSGYGSRLLGENMCTAVFDGGPAEPRSAYWDRAEAHFTDAMATAQAAGDTEIAMAAQAGRAAVRVYQGDWAGAVADAEAIPRDFVYEQDYHSVDWDDYNRFFWGNNYPDSPFRAHTVWSTFYEDYYEETGDPRTPWGFDPDRPVGTVEPHPWYFQLKHDHLTAPINLSSGREMVLIRAEAALRNGQVDEAMDLVNSLRADVGVDPWDPGNEEEAWVALKRERGIELWLEGRRLGDLWRWHDEGIPGQVEDMTGRSLCFPIGESEMETNPNLGPEDQVMVTG